MKNQRDFKGVLTSREMMKDYGCKIAATVGAIRAMAPTKGILSINSFKKAEKVGLLELIKYSENDIIELIKEKKPQSVSDYDEEMEVCEWCGGTSYIYDRHHLRKNRKVVNICGCCHNEFHHLESKKIYKLTELAEKYYGI